MFWIKLLSLLSILLKLPYSCSANDPITVCDRRPLGTKATPLPPDDRFQISINGIIDDQYIPSQNYTGNLP